MKNQIKKQLGILDKVVEAYKNPNNRGVTKREDGSTATCKYFAPAKDKRSKDKMCAVGMHLNKGQLEWAANNNCSVGSLVGDLHRENLLKSGTFLLGQPTTFWATIQSFHDSDGNFTKTGYSQAGKENIESIKDRIINEKFINA